MNPLSKLRGLYSLVVSFLAFSLFAQVGISQITDPDGGGEWEGVQDWPLIGIHAILTTDHQLLSFGTDDKGMQGGQVFYDVWDYETGVHYTLPNTTGTDIFCSVPALVPATGEVLIAGGDARPFGAINKGVTDVNIFDPTDRSLSPNDSGEMNFARWYTSAITLSDGRILLVGGRDQQARGVTIPEVFTPGQGFTSLPGAEIASFTTKWWYPRAWPTSDGSVVVVTDLGNSILHKLDPSGNGSLEWYGDLPMKSLNTLPAVMHRPDQFLIMAVDGKIWNVDVAGSSPISTVVLDLGAPRHFANMTLLPTGEVMILGGGSATDFRELGDLYLDAVIYNPDTGITTFNDSEAYGRLYHSTAILLPDATVLSLGGGAPGPFTQTNGEVYRPEYLFDSSGNLANRPVILNSPNQVASNEDFTIIVGDTSDVSRITMVKHGSVTHALNMETRFLEMNYSIGSNGNVTIDSTYDSNVMTPGAWMIFVIDSEGVPSVAKSVMVSVGAVGNQDFSSLDYSEVLLGTGGNDPIAGSDGDDWIEGLQGRDNINGGAGNDYINAGRGNDSFVRGGSGADVFAFGNGDQALKIVDWEIGEDRVHLLDGLQFSELTFTANTYNGATTVTARTPSGDRVLFQNTELWEINASDFVIGESNTPDPTPQPEPQPNPVPVPSTTKNKVSGRFFIDNNGNDLQSTGDTNVVGATVQLLEGSKVIATTTTNSSGIYSFFGFSNGWKKFRFIRPTGTSFVKGNQGIKDNIDSDVWNRTTGEASGFNFTGNTKKDVDAGIVGGSVDPNPVPVPQPSPVPSTTKNKVSGRFFIDNNGNDLQSTGDTNVAGATVQLLEGSKVIATTTTNSSGIYSFFGFSNGWKKLRFIKPYGTEYVRGNIGDNDNIDSDVWNAATGDAKGYDFTGNTKKDIDAGIK